MKRPKFTKYSFFLVILLLTAACSRRDSSIEHILDTCETIDTQFTGNNIDSLMHEVAKIEANPLSKSTPAIATFVTMLKARAAQFAGNDSTAIAGFHKVLATEIPTDTAAARWSVTMDNIHWSLSQLLNCYQMKGAPRECIDEFKSIVEHPTPAIKRYFMPDAYAILGYALSRDNQMDAAAHAIDCAMRYTIDSLPTNRKQLIYTYAAAACFEIPERQANVIAWCEKGIENAAQGNDAVGMQWLTTVLGSLYQRTGEVSKAIDLFRKSYKVASEVYDPYAIVHTCIMLCDLYLTYNMPQLADVYTTEATRVIEQSTSYDYPKLKGYTLLMKGRVMQQKRLPDSAVRYWHRADSIFSKLPYDSGMADLETAIGEMGLSDSITQVPLPEAITTLENVVARSVVAETRAKAYYFLARGYDKLNHKQQCEASLDSMVHLLNLSERPVYVEQAYRFGLDYYLKKGDKAKIELFSRKLNHEMELFYNQKTYDSMVGQMLQFQADKNDAQMRAAEAELSRKDAHIRSYVLLSLLLLVLLISALAFIINRRRIYRIKSLLAKERIDALISNLHEVNKRSDEMEQKLNSMTSSSDDWQRFATLTPSALRSDGEVRFRERFACIYPQFLARLRDVAPSITKREEILAMLIALDQNTDQIADVMCIARNSVNIMRHRMRQKMNLDKTDSLEGSLHRMLTTDSKPSGE